MQHIDVSGLRASVIGLGTWQFGTREWGYGAAYAEEVAPALVRRAVELGVTFIDTAEVYGGGRSEEIVGRALAGLAVDPVLGTRRGGILVATKLMPIFPVPRYTVARALASRRRLDIETIDLYQAHWPNPLVPLGTTMAGFRRLQDAGAIRHVGVSNYSLARWRDAERALARPVVSNQVRFSLASPGPLRELVPYARDAGRIVIAYSPLSQGLLLRGPVQGTGVKGGDGTAAETGGDQARRDRAFARRLNPVASKRAQSAAQPVRQALAEIAAAHGATPAQVALAWVVSHGNVIAIPGARTVEQLEQNAAAADLVLTADERDRLTTEAEAFAARRR